MRTGIRSSDDRQRQSVLDPLINGDYSHAVTDPSYTDPPLETVDEFSDAQGFLRALHPLNERWEGEPHHWIFRGHWDSTWELVPSLYRADRIQPFLPWDESFENMVLREDYDDIDTMERILLSNIFAEFDTSGLPIPEVQMVREALKNGLSFVPDYMVPFIALAQHHGIPTRLLDWSTQPRVAAYFAAAEVTKNSVVEDGRIEVIAMQRDAVLLANNASENDFCRIVHAPRASNANLHAQSGIFTVCFGQPALAPLDHLLTSCIANSPAVKTVIKRLTLPQQQAGALLHALSFEGVTGATMFPGYDGTTKKLRETRFYGMPYWRP